eukprot:s2559_g2.t1
MSSSSFTQRSRQDQQVAVAAQGEDEQVRAHAKAEHQGKEERPGKPVQDETADQMLGRLLDEMNTPGQERGEKSGTRSQDSTRRSSKEREAGEGVKALVGAGDQEVQKPVAAIQAGAGEITQKPAVVGEAARPLSVYCPNSLLDLRRACQRGSTVVYPGMVTGVMAAEDTDPWSAAKRVESMMESPQTPVRNLTSSMAAQAPSGSLEDMEKARLEALRALVLKLAEEEFMRGRADIQQELGAMKAACDKGQEVERVREPGEERKSSQSSGGSYKTACPEQKNIDWNHPQGQQLGVQVPPQEQQPGVQVHPHGQGMNMQALRPMDGYMNQGWGIGRPMDGLYNPNQVQPIGNPQAQAGGNYARQGHQGGGGMAFPGGNTGPMGMYGWQMGMYGWQGNQPGGHQGNQGRDPGPPGGPQGNPGQPGQQGGHQGIPGQPPVIPAAAPRAVGEDATETLRTVDLPKLSRASTAIGFGDWLTVVRRTIGDVSYSSAQWWGMIVTAVEQTYHRWLHADPLMRLRMALIVPDAARGWPRTETRVVGMLLQALPEDLYEEIVASRRMDADQILFKLYTVFQPGGQTERTSLLQLLVGWNPSSNNAVEIAASIRNWRRWVVRAEELQIVLPDPLVIAGVVAKMSDVLAKVGGAQVGYRLASVRQHLGIDLRPGMNENRMFSELLQAEAEELSLRQQGVPAEGSQPKSTNVVAVKSMSGPDNCGDQPKGHQRENPIPLKDLPVEKGERNWSCRLMRPMWFTRQPVGTG